MVRRTSTFSRARIGQPRRQLEAHGGRRDLHTGSYAIALWAMTKASVALVGLLRETSVIFVAPFGALFLGERFTGRRIFATDCVLGGLSPCAFSLFSHHIRDLPGASGAMMHRSGATCLRP